MNGYRNYDWLLGGSFDMEEKDTGRESLIEALSFFIGKFESFSIEQTDKDDLSAFNLHEELSMMEDLIENITSKIYDVDSMNESPEALVIALPAAVATLLGGLTIGTALFKTWVREGTILPGGLQGASHSIRRWLNSVTGAEKNKRRAYLAEKFKKQNPTASPADIKAAIARIEAEDKSNDERIKNKVMYGKREDVKSPKGKDVQKPYHLMDDKEKEAFKNKRFPNSGKKG